MTPAPVIPLHRKPGPKPGAISLPLVQHNAEQKLRRLRTEVGQLLQVIDDALERVEGEVA